jgi:hypothetical protein
MRVVDNNISKIATVVSCWNCPFHEYQDESDTHDCRAAKEGLFYNRKAEKAFRRKQEEPYVHPDCPLKEGGIVVKLNLL